LELHIGEIDHTKPVLSRFFSLRRQRIKKTMIGKLPTIQATTSRNSSPRNIFSGDETLSEESITQSVSP
jgi:hypothetical protein